MVCDIWASVFQLRYRKDAAIQVHIFAFFSVYVMSEECGHHDRQTAQQVWQAGLVAEVLVTRCSAESDDAEMSKNTRQKAPRTEEGLFLEADWTRYFLQQPLNGNLGHYMLKWGSIYVANIPRLENTVCRQNRDALSADCGHSVGTLHFKKEFISLHLKHLHFCFRSPAHILCLDLLSRRQVVHSVHCEDFLYAC